MDAEQVNQAGAQDALDAGQQNTSHDARRDLPVADATVQDTAPETPGHVPGEPSEDAPAVPDAAPEVSGHVPEEPSEDARPAPDTVPEAGQHTGRGPR